MKFVQFSMLTCRTKLNKWLVRHHRKVMLGQNAADQRRGWMTETIVPLMYGDSFTKESNRSRFGRRKGRTGVEATFTGTLKKELARVKILNTKKMRVKLKKDLIIMSELMNRN
jgi:hypothetical protein